MKDNIVPIRKTEKFGVYRGDVTGTGEIIEGESVGIAFLKPGSKKFRLKLWVMPSHQYFIMPDDSDDRKYIVLSLEEYALPNGEIKTSWNRIGHGNIVGSFIAFRIQLVPDQLLLCLFPEKEELGSPHVAA